MRHNALLPERKPSIQRPKRAHTGKCGGMILRQQSAGIPVEWLTDNRSAYYSY